MTSLNSDIFLSQTEQETIRKSLDQAGTISEYLSKAAEYLEEGKADWSDALLKGAPWLTAVTPYAGIVAGAVGIAGKLFKKWTEPTNPNELGAIACTLAWQAAARVAIEQHVTSIFAYRATKGAARRAAERIRIMPMPEEASLSNFSFEVALIHPFIQRADQVLRILLRSGGVPETEETKIFNTLHERFNQELRNLLADEKTASRFEPFTRQITSGVTEELRTMQALQIHSEYQRALFATQPLFGQELFTLKDIYLETECGELLWSQISPAYDKRFGHNPAELGDSAQLRVDPFSEYHGGRSDLLQTVLRLITSDLCNEPIVIQGYAGHGKTSFTLRLSAALLEPEQGFIPIRVRLKRLRLEGSLLESLARAIEFGDDSQSNRFAYLNGFQLTRTIFNTPHGKYHHLSRYILMLDGWDELEVSASEGFRKKVHSVLDKVRSEFLLGGYGCQVRVIVTGRPNPDVEASDLLQERTPVLTLRNLRPEQLQEFANKLTTLTAGAHDELLEGRWEAPDPAVFTEVFEQYKEAFEQTLPQKDEDAKVWQQGGGKLESHMEVLGLPLLAYLTVRVMSEAAAQHEGIEAQRAALIGMVEQPTQLYQCLTDMTCEKAGKAPFGDTKKDEDLKMARELGLTLRRKLRHTAAAMTATGQEHLSKTEWLRRLPKELTVETSTPGRATEDDPFVKLMISFYFKGGHQDQGIEFAHKSFREYLFAEHIVETLKEFGNKLSPDMPRRAKYWLNFPREDPRHKFVQTLGELFASQWLSKEVCRHVEELLGWEIARSHQQASQQPSAFVTRFGLNTSQLTFREWQAIRDALADLWEWWTDDVHLRPVFEMNEESGVRNIKAPMAQDWITKVCTRESAEDGVTGMESLTNVDARVGESIFRLCCLTHYYVAIAASWDCNWQGAITEGYGIKPFQTQIEREGQKWRLFCISKETEGQRDYRFNNWIARINSTFDRPGWLFPSHTMMSGLDLCKAYIPGVFLRNANLCGANLNGVSLFGAIINCASLNGANLNSAVLCGASLFGVSLNGANLISADISGARLGVDMTGQVTNLLDARNLTVEQLRMIDYLDEETILPPGGEFEELKKELLLRQRERATTAADEEGDLETPDSG